MMVTVAGSWILGNFVVAVGGVLLMVFGPFAVVSVIESQWVCAGRGRRAALWMARAAQKIKGERRLMVHYNWRWYDKDGQRLASESVDAVQAEAVQAGTETVLLRVNRVAPDAWRISPRGGHLGTQTDGATLVRPYMDPQHALAAVAKLLGMKTLERM